MAEGPLIDNPRSGNMWSWLIPLLVSAGTGIYSASQQEYPQKKTPPQYNQLINYLLQQLTSRAEQLKQVEPFSAGAPNMAGMGGMSGGFGVGSDVLQRAAGAGYVPTADWFSQFMGQDQIKPGAWGTPTMDNKNWMDDLYGAYSGIKKMMGNRPGQNLLTT